MQLQESKIDIVCDVTGCNKTAKYFVKKEKPSKLADSLKLCPDCAVGLMNLLVKNLSVKEKNSEKDN